MKFFSIFLWCLIFNYVYAQETCPQDEPVIVCYYASWAVYRPQLGYFNISHIDPTLCTHLVYTFAGIDINSKIGSLDPAFDINQGGYTAFTQLKETNPCLKTILAIGGWNEGSIKYSVMASTKESREAFVESVLRFVVTYGFDGFDCDWEYPTQRGGISDDRSNFAELLKQLHERLSKWNLLLTIAVPISQSLTENAYDVSVIKDYVDYVMIMAYDFTSTTSPITGLIAPLTEIDSTVKYWLSNGLSSKKLVLGVPTYARSYNLLNIDDHDIGAPTNGTGASGEYTRERGFLSYYELILKLKSNKYTQVKVDQNYYAYNNKQWFSYDLEDTYKAKAKYALDNKLAGIMVWSIDTDDFAGKYNETAYPVLNTVRNTMQNKQRN